jgi:hypothetical protein
MFLRAVLTCDQALKSPDFLASHALFDRQGL